MRAVHSRKVAVVAAAVAFVVAGLVLAAGVWVAVGLLTR